MKQVENKAGKAEFRFYEMPSDLPVLALLGERWEIVYGRDNMHFHNYLEIGYCYYGEGDIEFGKEKVHYRSGDITYIPENILHQTKAVSEDIQKWEYLFIDTKSILGECFKERLDYQTSVYNKLSEKSIIIAGDACPRIKTLIQQIFDEIRVKKKFYRYIVRAAIQELLLEYARLCPDKTQEEMEIQNADNLERIRTVLEYMNQHYAEEIRADMFTKISGLSETHLRRIFREYMNASLMDYLNLVRISKSCQLLTKTNESIGTIALDVGFLNVSTYLRNFKKVTGSSPHQWRMETRKNPQNPAGFNVSVLKGWLE